MSGAETVDADAARAIFLHRTPFHGQVPRQLDQRALGGVCTRVTALSAIRLDMLAIMQMLLRILCFTMPGVNLHRARSAARQRCSRSPDPGICQDLQGRESLREPKACHDLAASAYIVCHWCQE